MGRKKMESENRKVIRKTIRMTETEAKHLKILKKITGRSSSKLMVEALRYYAAMHYNLPGFGMGKDITWKCLEKQWLK